MKRINSILTAFLLCLMAVTTAGCDEDYRDMVLFEGVEPIYQIGTCDNLVSSLTVYLTDIDAVVLGIDGGDGNYKLDVDNPDIAGATFAESINNYRRIKILPKSEGVTNITVKDGGGSFTKLSIKVYDTYRIRYRVQDVGYMCKGEITDELWKKLQKELASVLPVQKGGDYTFQPNARTDAFWGGGKLYVHPSALVQAFVTGTYEMAVGEDGKATLRLRYNDEVRELTTSDPFKGVDTRTDPMFPVIMFEDVTHLVSQSVPAGCKVYRLEKWMYD